jgi:hypothetical protein
VDSTRLAPEASTGRLTKQPASTNVLGPQAFEQECRLRCAAVRIGNSGFVEQAVNFWSHCFFQSATEKSANLI